MRDVDYFEELQKQESSREANSQPVSPRASHSSKRARNADRQSTAKKSAKKLANGKA